ncbi:MAG TPA: MotA/TolQ/ExbB proton channel family protein [Polyangiales bacterium]|nr:MotA/TolQ/ExbB proton channel family protein [Polyangiales bacterium]
MLIEKLLKFALLGSSWVMYLLLGLSVVSIATMIERWVFFRRRRDDVDELGEKLIACLERNDSTAAAALLKQSRSVEATVLNAGVRYWGRTPESIEDAIAGEMLRERRELERGMTFMGTLGNNAPFIGLLGTVIGVIIAFQQLGSSQAAASMGAVMSGIAEALVATGVGLFVALPAVVAYNIVQKAIADIEDNVTAIMKEMTALLRAGESGRGSVRPPALEAESDVESGPQLRDLVTTGETG